MGGPLDAGADRAARPRAERPARAAGFTVRSDELHRAHPFRRMAARWDQQRAVERLELERLGARGRRAQIEAILGERPDGELVELVFERSEGIPLFVEELLGAVRDGGVEPGLPPAVAARRAAGAGRSALRGGAARASRGVGRGALGPGRAARGRSPECPRTSCTRRCGRPSSTSCSWSIRRAAGTRFAMRWRGRRSTRISCPASARGCTGLMPRRWRRRARRSGAGGGRDARPPLAGGPRSPAGAARRRCVPAGPPPRHRRRRRPSATSSSRSSCGPQVPDSEQRAGISHRDLLSVAAAGGVPLRRGGPRAGAGRSGAGRGRRRRGRRATRAAARPARGHPADLGREDEAIAVLEQAVALLPAELPSRASAHVLAALARALLRADSSRAPARWRSARSRRRPGRRRARGGLDARVSARLLDGLLPAISTPAWP